VNRLVCASRVSPIAKNPRHFKCGGRGHLRVWSRRCCTGQSVQGVSIAVKPGALDDNDTMLAKTFRVSSGAPGERLKHRGNYVLKRVRNTIGGL